MPETSTCRVIAVVLTPAFNAMATVAFLDPLRAANYLANRELYRWRFLSGEGGNLAASNGMVLAAEAIDIEAEDADLGVVSSSWSPERFYEDRRLMGLVRAWARRGTTLCGLDTGAMILAHSGRIDGRTVTVHYEHVDALREVQPRVGASERLFVVDGPVMSACGGVASVDLALHLLRSQHGDALANAAARYIFHDRLRGPAEHQNPAGPEPIGRSAPAVLRAAIALMEAHLDDIVTIPEIAARIGLSQRQLGRLFRLHVGLSPVQYYRDIRLDRGRALVTQTEMSVLEIAVACGFASAEHFSRAYRLRFSISPREDRVAGRLPFPYRAWPMHPRGENH